MLSLNLVNKEFLKPIEELGKEFPIQLSEKGIETYFIKSESSSVEFEGNKLTIKYKVLSDLYFIIGELISKTPSLNLKVSYKSHVNLTYMADCSRNAVMTTETAKKLIRHLAIFGYDSFQLYTEDTLIIPKYAYFGYLRNGYSKQDIQEIDQYCKLFGIELVPCIQTLAHFNTVTRYPTMENLFDIKDILMVGEKRTYEFLEELIKTCREYFSSDKINVGMDEAHLLGRGQYLDKNGFKRRFEIMNEHVKKVIELCDKYNFKPKMWSDMYFGEALRTKDYNCNNQIPSNIELIYWDYYSIDEKHFIENLKFHKKLSENLGYAGGAWKWCGYTPDNSYSLLHIKASIKGCIKEKIPNYYLTGWGDNGAEASQFSNLPSLAYAGNAKYGLLDLNSKFKDKFAAIAGICFKDFMYIDLGNRIREPYSPNDRNTANKYLLFNDVLLGTMDTIIDDKVSSLYESHYKKLKRAVRKDSKWSYLLKTQESLCKLLSLKADIGIKLRAHYKQSNNEELSKDLATLKKIRKLIDVFYEDLSVQWSLENRANGFDVQDLRIGALKQRIEVAIEKINQFLQGKITAIPELNEELLCFNGHEKSFEKDYDNCEFRWLRISSVNVND